MKKWFIFYITLLVALLINGYFGIFKDTWIYSEAINMFLLSILCFANGCEYYLNKKKK